MKHLLALTLMIVVLTAVACVAGTTPSPPPSEIGQPTVPTPVSSLIEELIWQTDGQFGYRILRPANWRAVNLGVAQGYRLPGLQDTDDRILFRVVNFEALDMTKGQSTGMNATLFLFEENPSLEAWTAGIERMWDSSNLQFTLLDELPQAKIYSVETPDFPSAQIAAFAVDQGQPLGIGMTASGIYADIEHLQAEGIIDDFTVMVESVQSIEHAPAHVTPPLPER